MGREIGDQDRKIGLMESTKREDSGVHDYLGRGPLNDSGENWMLVTGQSRAWNSDNSWSQLVHPACGALYLGVGWSVNSAPDSGC